MLVEIHVDPVWQWAVGASDLTHASSVCQMVWLRLADSLTDLGEERLTAWLQRAVHEEAKRLLRECRVPRQRLPRPDPRLVDRAHRRYDQ